MRAEWDKDMDIDEMMLQGICLKKLLEKKMAPLMQEYGLRPVELDILFFLDMQKGVDTARELIRIRHLSKAHISKSVDNLRKRGFITLMEDGEDHRLMHIRCTERAKEAAARVRSVYQECQNIVMKDITAEEYRQMEIVLGKISRNVERELG